MRADPTRHAVMRRGSLAAWLQKSKSEPARSLGNLLKKCAPKARCKSAACPVCGLKFQELASSAAKQALVPLTSRIRSRMSVITIVPSSGIVPPGELSEDAFRQVRDEVLAAISSLPPMIGSVEASFHDVPAQAEACHWSIHAHLLGVDWLSDAEIGALRNLFPPSDCVKRPVKIVKFDGEAPGWQYPFKPERVRKVDNIDAETGLANAGERPRRRSLLKMQAVELAVVEHKFGFSDRLLLHRVDDKALRAVLVGSLKRRQKQDSHSPTASLPR